MRLIPTTMATQHPDNASSPWWHNKPFLSTENELEECFRCFSDLGIDEYNWDWEGKFVDEAVVDRLLHKHFVYFQEHRLGRDKFLTFRLPNPRVEKQFRLARAFMVMVTSSQFTKSLDLPAPIFETILPLTETASEIFELQVAFRELVTLNHPLLGMSDSLSHIEIIPLFEQVEKIMDSAEILREYFSLHKKAFGKNPAYVRPYCARSDPALNAGLIPTMLALKVALSSYEKLETESGVRLHPMVGTGSLPFRGGITPDGIDRVIDEYRGVRTLTIQSAFRYDYPKNMIKKAIEQLHHKLPRHKAERLDDKTVEMVRELVPSFQKPYRATIEALAGRINHISSFVEKRRERMQHVGLFGYSRGIGKVSLPRAIPFTASLYSIGIPPELIGSGRGIVVSRRRGMWENVSPLYRNVKLDMIQAGNFLNRKNLEKLARKESAFKDIQDDITILEDTLGIEMGPRTEIHRTHQKLSGQILNHLEEGKDISKLITEAGILRKSLG